MSKPKVWPSGNSNCVWYTDERLKCDECGKRNDIVIEMKHPVTGEFQWFCHLPPGRKCYHEALLKFFGCNPDIDHVLSRLIECPSRPKRKRESMGLAKRHEVMKRDGFQCVLCGASGATAQLEIDHKTPVAAGGSDKASNLQTLCFNCNRGKSDS